MASFEPNGNVPQVGGAVKPKSHTSKKNWLTNSGEVKKLSIVSGTNRDLQHRDYDNTRKCNRIERRTRKT